MTEQSCVPVFQFLTNHLEFGNFPKSQKVDSNGRCVLQHGLSASQSIISVKGEGLASALKNGWLPKSVVMAANLAEAVNIKAPFNTPRTDEALLMQVVARRDEARRSLNVDEMRIMFGDTLFQLKLEANGVSLGSREQAESSILGARVSVLKLEWRGARETMEMPFSQRDVVEVRKAVLTFAENAPVTAMSAKSRSALQAFVGASSEAKGRFQLELVENSDVSIGQMVVALQRLNNSNEDGAKTKEAVSLAFGDAKFEATWEPLN
ncbi:MAG: hypothetical protein AAGF53_13445 [Pseudomonadota bacterium]